MEDTKKRMDNLDLMKAIGILMVISLHVPLWDLDFISNFSYSRVIEYGFRLIAEGVPVFVTINGFLLLRKNDFVAEKHFKKILKLFAILLIWSVILAFFGLLLDRNVEHFGLRELFTVILNTKVGAPYTGVLWFLQKLLVVYLLFPVLWYLYKNQIKLFQYLFLLVGFFVIGMNTLWLVKNLCTALGVTSYADMVMNYLYQFNFIVSGEYIFYFMLGGMLWHYYDKLVNHKVLLSVIGLVSWPVAFAFGYIMSKLTGVLYNPAFNYGSVFMAIFIIGMFALTSGYQDNNIIKHFIASVGRNTFGMYLSHFLFIFLLYYIGFHIGDNTRFLAYLVVVVCSYLFAIIVKRIPGIRWIIQL